ncbi:lysophospholipid acyltransferase family protein [Tropicimonas sp.]|uniref:lysophospholipid acyltransferase family protein n=1 Tax=Tropicimonas sp. TaxID=2067044 RepID=UPI003A8AFA2D
MSDDIGGTWGQWAQDRGIRAAIWAARRFPYERRVPAFGALTRYLAAPMTPFRRRMLDNLHYVWPEMPESERNRIAGAAADNTGRTMIEHYSMDELAARLSGLAPVGPGTAALDAAAANGRPVILMTGHFGNYEAGHLCLAGCGVPVGGFYRPMKNPYINRHYVEVVATLGSGPLFPQGRAGMGHMLRHLKGGGAAIILNDLYVGSGIEMPFLGRPAMTSLSAADLALKLGAALLPFYSTRHPDGLNFTVEIEAEIPASDAETMTAAFNRSLEARIGRHPEQWFWMHRRWKSKWNRGSGLSPGLHPAALPRRRSR